MVISISMSWRYDMGTHGVVVFRFKARVGHFLRAEASASALTYPVPPRTALLGLVGAVLGFDKDVAPLKLSEANLAISGAKPMTHWHRAKLRKDPPSELPLTVKRGAKGSSKPERATLVPQEWLVNPNYTVFASLPDDCHSEFVRRLRENRYFYSPCMGLSEMVANVEYVLETEAEPCGEDASIRCTSIARADLARLESGKVLTEGPRLSVHVLDMPQSVTSDRVFMLADYLYEVNGYEMPLVTSRGWRYEAGGRTVEYMYL